MMPFLKFIVNEDINNLYLIFMFYLSTTVIGYFISYKDALLGADQNSYKVTFITGGAYVLNLATTLLLGISVIATIFSGIDYLKGCKEIFKEEK